MKKVFSSRSGAVLFNSLFTMHLQKGSVNCISFIEVSLELLGLLLLVVSLSKFVSLDCGFLISFSVGVFSHSTSSGDCSDHVYPCGFCSILIPLVFFREFY